MLVTEKLHLNLNKIANQDQVLILTGTTWEDFEELTSEEYLEPKGLLALLPAVF